MVTKIIMEKSIIELSDLSQTSGYIRDQSDCGLSESVKIYDSAQDILNACNKDLEELRMKILKSSVRCHMLEVDLATQFNPQNQQMFADAQESCQMCTETIHNLEQDVSKLVSASAATETAVSKDMPTAAQQQTSATDIASAKEHVAGGFAVPLRKEAVVYGMEHSTSNLQNENISCMEQGSQ